MSVIGVDGCRGGWLAAEADDAGDVAWTWTRDIAEVLTRTADAIAIDIPIGLVVTGVRSCDVAARRRLGARGATVFPAPPRVVLDCVTYADARATLRRLGPRSMSAQAFGIVAAVRAVDAVLNPRDEVRVVEAHPELAFAAMTGRPLPPKKSPLGASQRLEALIETWPGARSLVAAAPPPAAPDDAMDALACAWTAQRWRAGTATVIGDGERDGRGLLMRIVT